MLARLWRGHSCLPRPDSSGRFFRVRWRMFFESVSALIVVQDFILQPAFSRLHPLAYVLSI
ncbi:hypothetical protein SBA4_7120009 [Candidatus Sulfopaludibacter sp. SbA4]|nr:hypothetical protein SBA4_7120009 [Candidatus Sulfopaludibacter sp. SbA4]